MVQIAPMIIEENLFQTKSLVEAIAQFANRSLGGTGY